MVLKNRVTKRRLIGRTAIAGVMAASIATAPLARAKSVYRPTQNLHLITQSAARTAKNSNINTVSNSISRGYNSSNLVEKVESVKPNGHKRSMSFLKFSGIVGGIFGGIIGSIFGGIGIAKGIEAIRNRKRKSTVSQKEQKRIKFRR